MLAFLWRALIFISALWFVQRILGFIFGAGKNRPVSRGARTQSTNRMVKDPVCGMYLDLRLAIPFEDKNGTYYFCSKECRSKYLANPV